MNQTHIRGRSEVLRHERAPTLFFVLLVLIVLVVFKDFLFGDRILLYTDIGSDSVNGFYPNTAHVIEYLQTEGVPKWSFNRGMGQNLFPGSLSDPSVLLLALLGKEKFAFAIVYVEILKIMLAGIFFFLFLRLRSLSPLTTVLGGLLYAFHGYLILGTSGWFNHSFEPLFAAAMLYAIELFIQRGRWWLLPIVVALAISYQALHLYLFGLFLAGYVGARFLLTDEWRWKELSLVVPKFAGVVFLGVGLSAVFFFANVGQLLESPRVQGNLSSLHKLSEEPVFQLASPYLILSLVARLFSVDMLGTGDVFRGWANYLESPVLYCGTITLLLAPHLFLRTTGKRRLVLIGLACLCLLPLAFPYVRYLFWGFSGPYFRMLSLFEVVALLLFGLHAFSAIEREGKVDRGALLGTTMICIALLSVSMVAPFDAMNSTLRWAAIALLLLYTLLLVAFTSPRFHVAASIGLLTVVVVELAWFAWIPVNSRETVRAAELRAGLYRDDTENALQFARERDGGLYRIEKDYASGPSRTLSLNDAQVQGYFGTVCYHSFNQPSYIRFLQAMELIPEGSEPHARWAMGVRNAPGLHSFAGIRYILTKRSVTPYQREGYDSLATFGRVTVLRNPGALPLGFTYERGMREADFRNLSKSAKERLLMRAFVMEEHDTELARAFQEAEPTDTGHTNQVGTPDGNVNALRRDTLAIAHWSQNRIDGTINVDRRKLLFLSIPYDRGWKASVDGQRAALYRVNVGFLGLIVESGERRVELEYTPPYVHEGLMVSIISALLYAGLLLVSLRTKRST